MQERAPLAAQSMRAEFVARIQARFAALGWVHLGAQFRARLAVRIPVRFARLPGCTCRVQGQDRELRPAEAGRGFGLRGDTSRGLGSA